MTLHWISFSPSFALLSAFGPAICLHISLRLLPVVEQLYWGYCVNATARSTPSLRISSMQFSVNGLAYRNAT